MIRMILNDQPSQQQFSQRENIFRTSVKFKKTHVFLL